MCPSEGELLQYSTSKADPGLQVYSSANLSNMVPDHILGNSYGHIIMDQTLRTNQEMNLGTWNLRSLYND